jgi:hypothetical protein
MAGNPAFIFMNPTVKLGTGVAGDPDYVCEVTRVELTNDVTMVDTGSLCGAAQQPGKIQWTLNMDGYQAYETTTLWRYLWDHSRQQAEFLIIPKDTTVGTGNPAVTGTVICVPATLGGTREEVAAFTVALPVVGDPLLSDTAPAALMAELQEGDETLDVEAEEDTEEEVEDLQPA